MSQFLKIFGVQCPTSDLIIPSIEMMMFGFIIGWISAFWSSKIEFCLNNDNKGHQQCILNTQKIVKNDLFFMDEEEYKTLHLTINHLEKRLQEKTDEITYYHQIQKKTQRYVQGFHQEIEKEDDIRMQENGNEHVQKEQVSTLRQSIPTSIKDVCTLRQSGSSRLFFNTLNDSEKSFQYKKRIKEYKLQQRSDQQQISLLKSEIKALYSKLDNSIFFEGKITSSKEFVDLFIIAFHDYKPNKKSKEAYMIIEEYIMKSIKS